MKCERCKQKMVTDNCVTFMMLDSTNPNKESMQMGYYCSQHCATQSLLDMFETDWKTYAPTPPPALKVVASPQTPEPEEETFPLAETPPEMKWFSNKTEPIVTTAPAVKGSNAAFLARKGAENKINTGIKNEFAVNYICFDALSAYFSGSKDWSVTKQTVNGKEGMKTVWTFDHKHTKAKIGCNLPTDPTSPLTLSLWDTKGKLVTYQTSVPVPNSLTGTSAKAKAIKADFLSKSVLVLGRKLMSQILLSATDAELKKLKADPALAENELYPSIPVVPKPKMKLKQGKVTVTKPKKIGELTALDVTKGILVQGSYDLATGTVQASKVKPAFHNPSYYDPEFYADDDYYYKPSYDDDDF